MTTYKDAPGRLGRTMNSQMNISLPIELHERLREIAWQTRQPLSHVCRELLAVGLRQREKGAANGTGSEAVEAEP